MDEGGWARPRALGADLGRARSARSRAWSGRLRAAGPREWSRRVQLALLVVIGVLALGLTLTTALLPVSATSPLAPIFAGLGAASFVYRWLRRYRGVPPRPLWTVLEAFAVLLVTAAGGGWLSPQGLLALALIYAGLCYRSLGASWLQVVGGVVLYLVAHVAGVIAAASGHPADQELLAGVLQAPGFAVSAVVSRVLAEVLERHERAAAGERVLLRAGKTLAGMSSAEQVLESVVEALQSIADQASVAVRAVAAVRGGRWIEAVAGPGRTVRLGPAEPPSLPWTYAADLQSGRVVECALGEADRGAFGIEEEAEQAVVVPLVHGSRLAGLIVVAASPKVPDGLRYAAEALAQPALVALNRLASTDDLRRREASFRALVQHSSDMLLIVGPDSRIRYQTPAVERLLGYRSAELVGRRLVELVHPDDAQTVAAFIDRVAATQRRLGPAEWRFRCADGSWLHAETVATNLLRDAHVGGIVLTTRDVTERKRAEAEWRHRAYHDPLTNLPNRAFFMDRLQSSLAAGQRRSDAVAVLFVDLDGFKEVNDTLGHEAGDRLLVELADRLRRALREQDVIARLGGDEFAIVLVDVVEPNDAVQTAERILDRLREPVLLDGQPIPIRASIGIALGTPGRDRPDTVLRQADSALYAAKRAGKSCYALYDEQLARPALEQGELARELRAALESGRLTLYYQPLVVLLDGRIGEVEALLRWDHPQRGLLLPSQFLDLAEETGLILPIGYWALEEACRQVRSWQKKRPSTLPLTLAVNLSARQLREPGVAAAIGRVLARTDFDPRHLRVEVSEAVVLAEPEAVKTLQALRALGVRIAIDDFGATAAALTPLTQLPVDALKIDGVWVATLGEGARESALVRGAVAFAKAKGLTIIAEGVETAAQARQLRELGFDRGQGYYFSGPLTGDAIYRLLRGETCGASRGNDGTTEMLIVHDA